MPFVTCTSGTRLHYAFHRGGQQVNDLDPSRPCVVLIHAIYTSSESWAPQLRDPRLNASYNLIVFDQKYHGKSTGMSKLDAGFQDSAADIAKVMDKLSIPASHFVGESNFGCRPCVHLAVQRPDLVRSMVLISPGVVGSESEDTKATLREIMEGMMSSNRAWVRLSSTLPDPRLLLPEQLPEEIRLPREFRLAYSNYHFSQVLPREEVERELEHMELFHACAPPEQNYEIKSMHINQAAIPGVESITQPVLLLRGSRNQTNDHDAEEVWREALKSSSNLEFHYIHGAPLRANACYPHLVTRFLVAWLAKNSSQKPRFGR